MRTRAPIKRLVSSTLSVFFAMPDHKIYEFNPLKLPPEYLQSIGLVSAASAHTEAVVNMAIGGCLCIDVEYNAAVTTHMSAPMRDNVLRAAAEIRIDSVDALDMLDEILDGVNEGFRKRNAYVHHSWCSDPETGQVFTVKQEARGSVDSELIPVTVDKIKEDAAFIYEAGISLMRFITLHKLFPTFPSQLRPRGHKTKAARKKRRKDFLCGKS